MPMGKSPRDERGPRFSIPAISVPVEHLSSRYFGLLSRRCVIERWSERMKRVKRVIE